ncbi:MAG: AraC family transcriptional regulator, partial [Pseudomonadota bacterium]
MASTLLMNQISALLDQSGISEGALSHTSSGMHFLRHRNTTVQDATLYSPLLCLVLQGAKEVGTSTRTLTVMDGQSLLVSHALPITSRITQATLGCPYVALVLPLDLELLRELVPSAPVTPSDAQDPFSISLCLADTELQDALTRYLDQSEEENTRAMLAPITL